jgi:hypothetical protein
MASAAGKRDWMSRSMGWNDVPTADSVSCGVCRELRKGRTGQIPVMTADLYDNPQAIPTFVSWRLCEHCHATGWRSPRTAWHGRVEYAHSGKFIGRVIAGPLTPPTAIEVQAVK